ncbi:hypothetical protein AUP07_0701 [methanogenic archaeon mixed culture ISO4-G1]|nr:hypothetical protein AUP07_0701 [methanogenic archaeon mixed culture ISO4-G1]
MKHYTGTEPTPNQLITIWDRATEYGKPSILKPQTIRKVAKEHPDIAVIKMSKGILEMAATIREYSDMPLLSKKGEPALVQESEKDILKGMMGYRSKVLTQIEVERPSKEEIESWVHLFIQLMIRTYTVADTSCTGGI